VQPEKLSFGGGVTETVMHPAVAAAMILVIVLVLVLPRQKVIAPFLLCTFLIPVGQTLVLGGLHLFVLRIVLLFACARVILAKFSSQTKVLGGGFNTFDKVFLVWAIYRTLAFLILYSFPSGALVNQGAFLLDVLGGYFFVRFLIHDDEDILKVVKAFAFIVAVVGASMLNEKFHNQNVFGYLGGYPPILPQVRDGAIRAQGPFSHPILAGSFAATSLPLFFWLWQSGKSKAMGILGAIGSTCMVLTCASSTPLLAYVAGIVAVCFWPLRDRMRAFRWGLACILIALHLVMKAPVWFLIARVDLTGASSGYHRAELVDQFVRHFSEWWFVGTNGNGAWGFDMWDLSNQFVAEGVSGGLVTFVCFLAMISMCFSRIGTARKLVEGDRKQEWLFWFLGAALLSHIVAFFGISYFDHTQIAWFALFAMIIAATAPLCQTKVVLEHSVGGQRDRTGTSPPPRSIAGLVPGHGVKLDGPVGTGILRSPSGSGRTGKT
jgi:hypothetical protein